MKILAQIIMFILVIHVTLAFSQQTITFHVDKTSMDNTSGINLYQNQDVAPFATVDTTRPQPWSVTGTVTLINEVFTVYAVPYNLLGIEGTSSEILTINAPDGSDITITIIDVK
jgi:hypothetical protein